MRRQTLLSVAVACVAGAVIFLPPLVFANVSLRVACLFFLTTILMVGLYVVTGLTRIVSLCHAALAGVGAYVSAGIALRLGWWPVATIFLGALAAVAVALLLAWCMRKMEDHYLALATLAASEILTNIFRSATALTGGANGLAGIPPLSLATLNWSQPASYYPFCAAIALGAVGLVWLFDRSPLGRALRAVGEEGSRVGSLGVSQSRLRAIGFALGGGLAGLAGAIGAHLDGFVGPESYGVSLSIGYLCFLVIAGFGRLGGAILAALLASIGQEYLRGFLQWQMIIVAVLALGFLYLRSTNLVLQPWRLAGKK
jgi:branched-chain amino acid transport system permease protein